MSTAESLIADCPTDIEIDPRLLGPKWTRILTVASAAKGWNPVVLLRAAVATGLTGGPPILEPLLAALEEAIAEGDLEPPSPSPKHGPN